MNAEDDNERTEPPLDAVIEVWHEEYDLDDESSEADFFDEYDEVAFDILFNVPNPEDFEA